MQEAWDDAATSIASNAISDGTTHSVLQSAAPSGASTPHASSAATATAPTALEASSSGRSSMPRAARRQLASVLDEFWGCYYDQHGGYVASRGVYASPLQCSHSQGRACCSGCGALLRREAAEAVQQLLQLQGVQEALFAGRTLDSHIPHAQCTTTSDSAVNWETILQMCPCSTQHLQAVMMLGNLPTTTSAAGADAPAAAAFVSFGLWCLIVLLWQCQVRSAGCSSQLHTMVLAESWLIVRLCEPACCPSLEGPC